MDLKTILSHPDLRGIAVDSRIVKKGDLFIALRGQKVDGHLHLNEVVERGAIALVVEDEKAIPRHFLGQRFVVPSTRQALNYLAPQFFGDPSCDLLTVAVTGTNGKTTTCHMIEHLLTQKGITTGVIGTIDHHLGDHKWETNLTTPSPLELQERLKAFKDLGASALAMEVSSHALDQERASSVAWNVGLFTNLSHDHLDYHGTMENYFIAKSKLFTELLANSPKENKRAIISIEDSWGERLVKLCPVPLWTTGQSERADFSYRIADVNLNEMIVNVRHGGLKAEFSLGLVGEHNVSNATLALALGVQVGFHLGELVPCFSNFSGVSGRLEKVGRLSGYHVFVDYAHTPDALENVLKTLDGVRRNISPRPRILTVFGCGGERDKGKRPIMAKAAANYSDLIFVTSDNPRSEDPELIIQDILSGFSQDQKTKSVLNEVDRRQAIKMALEQANTGDIILVAGKGHEKYQIIGNNKIYFSDQEVIEDLLK